VKTASESIDERIKELGDWRGKTLARVRALIHEADPEVVEEWKWMGTPIWSHDGIICTGETYKKIVKLTFHKGASLEAQRVRRAPPNGSRNVSRRAPFCAGSLEDPARLFNSSLEGNARRAIDIHEEDKINEAAFKDLILAAVALNVTSKGKKAKKAP
jgi:hypothetical protein